MSLNEIAAGPRSKKTSRGRLTASPCLERLESRTLFNGTFPTVPDVQVQFEALKHHAEGIGWRNPEDLGAPDSSLLHHYQGVARYPGTGTPILYVTKLDDSGGYLNVVRMGSRNTDGERFGSNLQAVGPTTESTIPPAEDTWIRTTHFDGSGVVINGQEIAKYKHPGGMAIADNVLFMAMDQKDGDGAGGMGMLILWDLGEDGANRENPTPMQAIRLDHGIDNVAVIKQPDDTYLIWCNGDGGSEIHIYNTTGPDIRHGTVELVALPDWNPNSSANFDGGDEELMFPTGPTAQQSSTFIRQDGPDSPLYLIAMRRNGPVILGVPDVSQGTDYADLYRVTQNQVSHAVKLTEVRRLHFHNEFDGVGTLGNFYAADGAYVSPTGEIILYSIQHDDEDVTPDYVKMAEFRHEDENRPDSPLRDSHVDAGGSYTVDEGRGVTLISDTSAPLDRPWVELYDDDHGWFHDYEAAEDYRQDRSIVVDYDDRNDLELNNFDNLDDFGDNTSSVRWRSAVGLDIVLYADDSFHGGQLILKGTGETEFIANMEDVVIQSGVIESPGYTSGQGLDFGGATSSLKWAGDPPPHGRLPGVVWDLDGDGIFGETGAGATRGDENTLSPTFDASGIDGPADFTVKLRATDVTNGQPLFSTATVHVQNVPPTISNLQATAVDENGLTTLTGDIIEPGDIDPFSLDLNWGDSLSTDNLQHLAFAAGTEHFSLTHRYLDDNPTGTSSDSYTISVTATDDEGAANPARTTTVTVRNVAPTIVSLTSSATASTAVSRSTPIVINGQWADVGTLDTVSATVNWGDGTSASPVTAFTTGHLFSASHLYAKGGVYSIGVTLSDDDTGSVSATTTAYVIGVSNVNGELVIIGPPGKSGKVEIKKSSSNLQVTTDFDTPKTQTFPLASIQSIRALMGRKDDEVKFKTGFAIRTFIDGGAGNDDIVAGDGPAVLFGGTGNDDMDGGIGEDILIGGEGDDDLAGKSGRDLLIGGSGKDTLNGDDSDDIMIGALYAHDTDLPSLQALLAEWRRTDVDYAGRVAHLTAGGGLNGVTLLKSSTVTKDGVKNKLKGKKGSDLFFSRTKDDDLDPEKGEKVVGL